MSSSRLTESLPGSPGKQQQHDDRIRGSQFQNQEETAPTGGSSSSRAPLPPLPRPEPELQLTGTSVLSEQEERNRPRGGSSSAKRRRSNSNGNSYFDDRNMAIEVDSAPASPDTSPVQAYHTLQLSEYEAIDYFTINLVDYSFDEVEDIRIPKEKVKTACSSDKVVSVIGYDELKALFWEQFKIPKTLVMLTMVQGAHGKIFDEFFFDADLHEAASNSNPDSKLPSPRDSNDGVTGTNAAAAAAIGPYMFGTRNSPRGDAQTGAVEAAAGHSTPQGAGTQMAAAGEPETPGTASAALRYSGLGGATGEAGDATVTATTTAAADVNVNMHAMGKSVSDPTGGVPASLGLDLLLPGARALQLSKSTSGAWSDSQAASQQDIRLQDTSMQMAMEDNPEMLLEGLSDILSDPDGNRSVGGSSRAMSVDDMMRSPGGLGGIASPMDISPSARGLCSAVSAASKEPLAGSSPAHSLD